MTGAEWLLLCLVTADDAPDLVAALAAAGCGATARLGNGAGSSRCRSGVLVIASPGEVPLVLAAVRRTCARRLAAAGGGQAAALTILLNPLAEEIGGATVLAVPVRNSTRWALGDLSPARAAARRWDMLDTAIVEAESFPPPGVAPTRLLIAVVPDEAAERALAALAQRQVHAMTIGSTGGLFRRGNTTIVADVPAEQAQLAAETIRSTCVACREADAPGHGVAFALDVAWQVRL